MHSKVKKRSRLSLIASFFEWTGRMLFALIAIILLSQNIIVAMPHGF
jgi:hypothetical protein